MSRKDYVRFADMLRIKVNNSHNSLKHAINAFVVCEDSEREAKSKDIDIAEAECKAIDNMVSEIADTFASDNGSFNRDKFFAAVYKGLAK